MNEELLQQAMGLFESPEKWSAFVELMNRSGEIQNYWWKKLQQEVYQREKKDLDPNWNIHIWNHWDIEWYIKGETVTTLTIHFWGDAFIVHNHGATFDINKLNDLICEPRFDIIKQSFDRVDEWSNYTIAQENKNFTFGSIYDGRFTDNRILAWYAGNRTKEFADQLIHKVRKLQTPEITELFKEINTKCKKEI